MVSNNLAKTALHSIPRDVRAALVQSRKTVDAWNDITPLARNEWVCWITSAKKSETRAHRLQRTCTELAAGKRRPCCWPGCVHR